MVIAISEQSAWTLHSTRQRNAPALCSDKDRASEGGIYGSDSMLQS